MNKKHVITPFFITLIVLFISTGISFSAEFSTVEGTIQGASCTVHKSRCPLNTSDPHIALEQDFVIVTSSGAYYFLPNVSRVIKVKCLNRHVRITGDKKEGMIVVSKIDIKDDNDYKVLWDWETIKGVNEISF